MEDITDRAEQQDLLYQQLTQAVLTSSGATTPLLRKALTEYAQQVDFIDSPRLVSEMGLPSDLYAYVTKVCKYAYKVTDEDIAQLLRAGYSEEAIFEITVTTALGMGTRCLLSGMAAIAEQEGANDALTDY